MVSAMQRKTGNWQYRRSSRIVLFICFLFLCFLQQVVAVSAREQTIWGVKSRGAFQAGEVLRYEIRYGLARGAAAQFEVRDTTLVGESAYRLEVVGWTVGLLDALYPVYDVYRSYVLKRNDLPLIAIRDVREQKYIDYKEDYFDRRTRNDSLVLTRENGERHVLPLETFDMVSAAYFVRNQLSHMDLKEGYEIDIPTFFNGEYYPMKVQYKGIEVVKTKFGRLKCYRFVPLVKVGDLFTTQDAISVWFTADENHIPVRVRFKLFLGSLYCDITSFSGLKWPLVVEMK